MPIYGMEFDLWIPREIATGIFSRVNAYIK